MVDNEDEYGASDCETRVGMDTSCYDGYRVFFMWKDEHIGGEEKKRAETRTAKRESTLTYHKCILFRVRGYVSKRARSDAWGRLGDQAIKPTTELESVSDSRASCSSLTFFQAGRW